MIAMEQIKQYIKKSSLPKIIAFAGSERALIDEALASIRAFSQKSDQDGLNYYRYRAQEDKPDMVVGTLKTIPFLGDKKFVELHDAEKINANDAKNLIDYITNPSEFSVFILVFNKQDKRNKLFSFLLEKKYLFLFEPLNEKEMVKFIQKEAEHLGVTIDHESAVFLQLSLEGDILAIKSALDKLSLMYENKQPTLEEIAQNVIGDGMLDVFRLARMISEGNLDDSLKELTKLRHRQENALKFLGVLVWQFRVLVHIRDCLERGLPEWDIRKEVSVFGDRFNWMLKVSKQRTINFHINRLTRLLQCDIFLKSQKTSDPMCIIEKAVYQNTNL
ncbi:MAG: DNA polymerase III subunit delta [Myxococcales bacterium]|nr:DNA polymerase III subunit delta [Myxococcales bacterium]USN51455.1 MAG: DNA polymerase III subunit delta [Myxococcales bacterium]